MKKLFITILIFTLLSSCVSKKKYTTLENDLTNTKGELQKTTIAKEELEAKFAKIKERVTQYNNKISTLSNTNNSLNSSLNTINNEKLVLVDDNTVVISNKVKAKMQSTLSKMSSEELYGAKTLKDSLNLAISYNLRNKFSSQEKNDDIKIDIDKTVVMISVSDKMLFSSGSYRVKSQASNILIKLADIINSEPSMDVIIEGHTDSQTIKSGDLKDNWDLSVKRATAIVRELQNKYNVEPSRLIASGRSSYMPIADNNTKKGRAKNRRTNIIILPNLNKFFALLAEDENIILD